MIKKARNADMNTAISIASYVINKLYDEYNEDGYDTAEYWFGYDGDLTTAIEKWKKPDKQTLVHEYIKRIHLDGQDYLCDKYFHVEVIREIQDLLDYYSIDYSSIGKLDVSNLEGDSDVDGIDDIGEYAYKLQTFYINNLLDIIVDDVFTILYTNKNFMHEFNRQCSNIIRTLKKENYPDLLKADGEVKRINYIPKWLKKGIFYRDKGRCSLCGCDLNMVFDARTNENYDHIIPLKKGGNNDPSNWQLTCETCNKSKGDRNTSFKNVMMPHWDV